jgi:superfamily II DNA/RNA helicase
VTRRFDARRPARVPANAGASAGTNATSRVAPPARPAAGTPRTHTRPAPELAASARPIARPSTSRPSINQPSTNQPSTNHASITTAGNEASFASLGVPAGVCEVLAKAGITTPFAIQSVALPDALAGRDVLGRARTGSGKTLAFGIPIAARLAARKAGSGGRPRALILVPTRELATQVSAALTMICRPMGLSTVTIFGGVSQGAQVSALKRGVDVVIACPGRLEDLVKQGRCDLSAIEISVLDEADHMADLGFLPPVRRLLDKTPANGQRLLFSATLDRGVDVLAKQYLKNPATHSVDAAAGTDAKMTHHVLEVPTQDKATVVLALATGTGRRVLFTRTKHGAKKLTKQLNAAGTPAVELHGNLAQNARQRNLEAFSEGRVQVLVATDIAARGIHVDDIALVVHVDPPTEHKAYLHRSGRTARAGSAGVVVTVCTPDQRADVRNLTRQANIKPTTHPVVPSTDIGALLGVSVAKQRPIPAAASAPAVARPTRGPRRVSGSAAPVAASRRRPPRGRGR